jgi:hypothetical protein
MHWGILIMLLHILWGMFFGYIIASVNFAAVLVSKGYRSVNEIPEKELNNG